jgi:hypothetical protein
VVIVTITLSLLAKGRTIIYIYIYITWWSSSFIIASKERTPVQEGGCLFLFIFQI